MCFCTMKQQNKFGGMASTDMHGMYVFLHVYVRTTSILSRVRVSVTNDCGFQIWCLGLLDATITITLYHNSSYIGLHLNEVCLPNLALISSLSNSGSGILPRVRVRVTLRLAVYRQTVRLGAKTLETHGQNFFSKLNTCGHSLHVTSSRQRRWICHLQLLLGLASAFILRSESRRTDDHILLSQIGDSPKLELGSPYLYPPRTGWLSYTPALGSISVAFTARRTKVEVIWTLLHTLEGQSAMLWCINSRWTEYKT
jgi:hypothetical protein